MARPLWSDLVAMVAVAVLMQFLEFHGIFSAAEGKAADFFHYLSSRGAEAEPRIVTIGIDNQDYAEFFGGSSPLNPASVVGLVDALHAFQPAVIAVDILTDSPAYRGVAAAARYASAEGEHANAVAVVWASGPPPQQTRVASPGFARWLLGASEVYGLSPGPVLGRTPVGSQRNWGVPLYPLDEDRTVRRMPRVWSSYVDNDVVSTATLARRVRDRYCRGRACADLGDRDEVFLSYSTSDRAQPVRTLRDLFTCGTSQPPCENWMLRPGAAGPESGAIVVLGGTFDASRDFYPTPLDGKTPGLIVNALAVRAEIRGLGVYEAPRSVGFLADLVVGLVLVAVSRRFTSLRHQVLFSLLIGAMAVCVSCYLFFRVGVLWLSWVGMLLTGLSLDIAREAYGHDSTPSHTPTP